LVQLIVFHDESFFLLPGISPGFKLNGKLIPAIRSAAAGVPSFGAITISRIATVMVKTVVCDFAGTDENVPRDPSVDLTCSRSLHKTAIG
jgi:hypothetical protein